MKRMITDKPEDNYSAALNLFYIKGQETWVRGGGTAPSYSDVTLDSYIKELCKSHDAEINTKLNPEEFSYLMAETLFDGPDTIEGLLATLYTAGWAFSVLRWKLEAYENTGIPPIVPEETEFIDAVISVNSKIALQDTAIEKMSKLTEAIGEYKRTSPNSPESVTADIGVVEAVAEVYIALVQLIKVMQLNHPNIYTELDNIIKKKLKRSPKISCQDEE